MFIETIVVGLVIGAFAGGRFFNLKNLALRHLELFLLAFLIQLGLDFFTVRGTSWAMEYKGYIHLFSYVLLFTGLFLNRHIPGIKILCLGVFLNFLVIAFNQGLMPVSAEHLPLELKEALHSGMNGTHALINEGTRLEWLADWIYFSLPWTNQMVSVGDIVIDIGVLYLIIIAMKDRGELFKFTYINRQL